MTNFPGLVEDVHPVRAIAYYVPENRPHGKPGMALQLQMDELYLENGWDPAQVKKAAEDNSGTPKIRRIK